MNRKSPPTKRATRYRQQWLMECAPADFFILFYSVNSAHAHRRILVRALESARVILGRFMLGEAGPLHNYPGNPILLSQPFEIFFTEPLKVLLIRNLFRPLHRKRRKHGTCSLVFNKIRQPAALGTSPKSIFIFAG